MNCVYYGKGCHPGWGLITARLFERDKEPDFEAFNERFPINLVYLLLIFLYPLPAMKNRSKLLLAYMTVLSAMNMTLPFSRRKCGMNDVCPLGERVERVM